MLSPITLEEIKFNLLYILDDVVKSRQYLNKHFQNSMNNYFLENYATLPCLKNTYNTQSGRQVRKEIYDKYTALQAAKVIQFDTLKCFLIMRGFVEEHRLNDSLEIYRETLAAMASAQPSASFNKGCAEWISHQWRRLFALMVLHHTYYPSIQGVYELWFHVFDERLIARERQKKRKEEPVVKQRPAPYLKTLSTKSEDEDFLSSQTSVSSFDQQPKVFVNYETNASSQLHHYNPSDSTETEPKLVKKRVNNEKTLIVSELQNTSPVLSTTETIALQSDDQLASTQTQLNFYPFKLYQPSYQKQNETLSQQSQQLQAYHPQIQYSKQRQTEVTEDQSRIFSLNQLDIPQTSYFPQQSYYQNQQQETHFHNPQQQYQYLAQQHVPHQQSHQIYPNTNIQENQPQIISFYPQHHHHIHSDEIGQIDEQYVFEVKNLSSNIPEPLFSKPHTAFADRFSDAGQYYSRQQGGIVFGGAPLFQKTYRTSSTYPYNYYSDVQYEIYQDLKNEDI